MESNTLTFRASSKKTKVDFDNRMIKDVIIAQAMQVKDYRAWNIDQTFLDDLTNYAKKNFKTKGVPCNYGHNYDNLGKKLGRIKNVSFNKKNEPIGDLHIYKAADLSPAHKDMGTYVLNLADEDKHAINLSISFEYSSFFIKDNDGKEIHYKYYWQIDEGEDIFVKFKALHSVDVVDEGAITNELFSKHMTNFKSILEAGIGFNVAAGKTKQNILDVLSSSIGADQFNKIMEGDLSGLTQEHIDQFASDLGVSAETLKNAAVQDGCFKIAPKKDETWFSSIKNFLKKNNLIGSSENGSELSVLLDQSQTAFNKLKTDYDASQATNQNLSKTIIEKDQAIQELNEKITELSGETFDKHTNGPTNTDPPKPKGETLFSKKALANIEEYNSVGIG